MRIGITGTHGAGKTTLARMLAEALGLPLIEEAARKAAAELGFRSLPDLLREPHMLREFQVLVFGLQVEAEKRSVKERGGFVSDRTALDCAAYWRAYGLGGTELGRSYEEACEAHARRAYDLVVYVPPEIPCPDDGFRDVDEGLRLRADLEIRRMLERVRPWAPVVAARGSPKERLEAVLAVLRAGRGVAQIERPGGPVAGVAS